MHNFSRNSYGAHFILDLGMSSDEVLDGMFSETENIGAHSEAVDVNPAFQALDELQEIGEVAPFKLARLRAKYSEVRTVNHS